MRSRLRSGVQVGTTSSPPGHWGQVVAHRDSQQSSFHSVLVVDCLGCLAILRLCAIHNQTWRSAPAAAAAAVLRAAGLDGHRAAQQAVFQAMLEVPWVAGEGIPDSPTEGTQYSELLEAGMAGSWVFCSELPGFLGECWGMLMTPVLTLDCC